MCGSNRKIFDRITMKNYIKLYTALFSGVLALSTAAIFVKLAGAPSSVTAFYRLLFTALALSPFLIWNSKNRTELRCLTIRQIALIILSGLTLAIHYAMWFESLNYTSVSSSTVLVALQPLFSLFYGFLFLKETVTKSAVTGCLIAIFGSAVIGWGDFQVSSAALFGDFLAFAAAGVISLYFLIGQIVRKEVSAVVYSVPGYFSSAAFLLLYALLQKAPLTGYSDSTWSAFLGLAFISTIGGQFVFNLLLRNLSATIVTMSILGEPVGTCILAFFLLDETIAAQQFLGMLIILIGLSIFFFYPILRKTKERALS